MKKLYCVSTRTTAVALFSCLAGQFALCADAPAPTQRVVVGSAVPGVSVISARSVILTPAAGGLSTALPLAADGSFTAKGLSAGAYMLRVASVTVSRQTQGATFGEKVSQGLHAAGGALAQGASKQGINANSMPNRISMNVTIAKRTVPLDVDGEGTPISVGADGSVAGVAKAP